MSDPKMRLCKNTVLATLLLAFAVGCKQEPRVSPSASVWCDLGGGKTINTLYSRPRMKGRKIYGDLVPFGKVWRAGANEATTFVTNSNLQIGGTTVPAGKYTIFTVPEPDKWALIINKKTGEWGIPYKYESDELTRVGMKLSTLPSPVEDFTIAYDKSGSGCALRMDWETTRLCGHSRKLVESAGTRSMSMSNVPTSNPFIHSTEDFATSAKEKTHERNPLRRNWRHRKPYSQ